MQRIFALLVVVFCAVGSFAQGSAWGKGFRQNLVSVSYGYNSLIMMSSELEKVTGKSMSSSVYNAIEPTNRTSIGAISAQIMHRNSRKVYFGLALAFEQTQEDCQTNISYTQKIKIGELTNRYISVMPLLRFNWVEKRKFLFYSKMAVGLSFVGDHYVDTSGKGADLVESSKRRYVAFQASPVGFSWGVHVRGFLELGYGTQGLAQAGVAYRF